MLAPISLSLLGTFRVERSGEPVIAFESNKVRALLAYLATEQERAHQRSALAGMLWPDHPEELARTNLRHVLRQLRQTLPDQPDAPPLLLISKQSIQCNPAAALRFDVAQFSTLLAASTHCGHETFSTCADCIERYTKAATLYTGPFLAGFALQDSDIFDEWAVVKREQLHRQALEIFFSLSRHYELAGEYELARQYAWQQIELEPWREEAHRQLMRVLALSGQRSAALAQYARCRAMMAAELGIEPDPKTIALYEAIRTGTFGPSAHQAGDDPAVSLARPSGAAPSKPAQTTSDRLIGRQRELTQLKQLWYQAQNGQSQLALIMGEPGIGKTRLTQALADYAQAQDTTILRGGCYEYEATTPYLPFVEGLRAYVHLHSAETLRAKLGTTAAELARLAPEIEVKLGVQIPSATPLPSDERLRLFDHIVRFLRSLAEQGGLLLLLDDLHWADRSTLLLLHYLLRHLRNERMLVVVAYREIELEPDHPLLDALAEWNRERLATQIPLERLSRAETDELLEQLEHGNHTADIAAAIYHETEGNPFFVEEVVKALLVRERLYAPDDPQHKAIAELEIPQSIKEAIGRRLRRLTPECNEILRTAAALGKTFGFTELAAVVPTSEDNLLNALDEASNAQLIRPNQGDSFTFTHDKIRETLYQGLNAIRRRRLHQRIGVALETLANHRAYHHDYAHVLAYHAVTGQDWPRGLKYSLAAAEQARRIFANDEALHYYQRAAQSAEALEQTAQRAQIAELMGDVYTLRGPLQSAIEHYQQSYELARDQGGRAALKVKIGRVYVSAGDDKALGFLNEALDELDPENQRRELATALAALGRLHHFWCQHARAISFLERASQLLTPFDDLYAWMDIFSHLAGASQHMAQIQQSINWAEQSIALAKRHNALPAAGASYDYLAQGTALLGKWQESLAYTAQGKQLSEETGDIVGLGWIAFDQAWSLHGQGRLSEAYTAAREAVARGEELGEQRLVAWANGALTLIQADLQLDVDIYAAADRMIAAADELGQPALRSNSRRSVAYLYIQRQEWQAAADLLDQALDALSTTDNRCEYLWFLGAHRADAYLGLGQTDTALEMIGEYLELARQAGSRYFAGLGLRVQAQILATLGDTSAIHTLNQAIAALEETDTRLELGRALYQRALMGNTSSELIQQDLERARKLFAECGAPRDLARVTALL